MRGVNDKLLRWGCRRGMLELDLLLLPFFDHQFTKLVPKQKAIFEELLSESDQDIYAWVLQIVPCPEKKFHPILTAIQKYHDIH